MMDMVDLEIRANNLASRSWFFSPDPYLNVYRECENHAWTLVKKTEVQTSTAHPHWRPMELGIDILCRGDLDRRLKFEVVDLNFDGSFQLVGEFITTLKELTGHESTSSPVISFELINAHKKTKKGPKYRNSGIVTFVRAVYRKRHSFLEYINGGMDLHFTVAVDFTLSNGKPNSAASLHRWDPFHPNQYLQVGWDAAVCGFSLWCDFRFT